MKTLSVYLFPELDHNDQNPILCQFLSFFTDRYLIFIVNEDSLRYMDSGEWQSN